jgi:Gpi18-like mannosyltransferase
MNISQIVRYLLLWRVAIFFVFLFSLSIFPLQFNFLGGGLSSYLHAPYLWSNLNFDGEHYATIAQNGYKPLEYFFFPMYPILIHSFSLLGSTSTRGIAISGLFVSNIALVVAVIGFVKLMQLDYSKKVILTSILLLLLFPTSFYFGSFYTESLFFAEVIWAMYFARQRNWLASGLIGSLACATRIVGVALIPALLVEIYMQIGLKDIKKLIQPLIMVSISILGIAGYMFFLQQKTGDPLAFFTSLNTVFGEQRSNSIILLPQVFYRYFIKILPVLNYSYFPQVFSTYLEIIVGLLFLLLSILSYFKLRLSYSIFLTFGYLIPTLSGSFSSFPRYALILFPGFIIMALYLEKMPLIIRSFVYVLFGATLFIAESLFMRGYWIS